MLYRDLWITSLKLFGFCVRCVLSMLMAEIKPSRVEIYQQLLSFHKNAGKKSKHIITASRHDFFITIQKWSGNAMNIWLQNEEKNLKLDIGRKIHGYSYFGTWLMLFTLISLNLKSGLWHSECYIANSSLEAMIKQSWETRERKFAALYSARPYTSWINQKAIAKLDLSILIYPPCSPFAVMQFFYLLVKLNGYPPGHLFDSNE